MKPQTRLTDERLQFLTKYGDLNELRAVARELVALRKECQAAREATGFLIKLAPQDGGWKNTIPWHTYAKTRQETDEAGFTPVKVDV